MSENFYKKFFADKKRALLAILIDPDKYIAEMAEVLSDKDSQPDFLLVGGSVVSASTDDCIKDLKQKTGLPVLLFPGDPSQLSVHADAVMMLMLLSGRNPEYLIGHHVSAVPFIREHNTETISTGYIVIGDHSNSSVCRVTQTCPIPENETERIISTAIAGQIIGNRIIYLEAGSGAGKPLDTKIISEVRKNTDVTIFSGGGICDPETASQHWKAGADVVVVGTAFEKEPGIVRSFVEMNRIVNH